MKVTIITVTYNSEKYIQDCIESVVNQTYKDIEHIVIDGASTDNTVQIINQYSSQITKWISQPDKGMYDAINKGMDMATGEIPHDAKIDEGDTERRLFLLEVVQPGLVGLMDGSVSTLAPIFAAAFATGNTWQTFLVGCAASVGAGISMGLAEGLSDDGKLSGRGRPLIRGLASGIMTAVGGIGHTLPFLIPQFHTALVLAVMVVLVELGVISWIRYKYMDTPFLKAALQIAVGGFLVFLTGILIGSA